MVKININKIEKPNINPLYLSTEPCDRDMEIIYKLQGRYTTVLERMAKDQLKGKESIWYPIRQSILDYELLNFQSFSYYMENEVYKNKKRDEFEHDLKITIDDAVFTAYLVGKDFKNNNPYLTDKYIYKDSIEINDIPNEEIKLLEISTWMAYYLFGLITSDYYDSNYGKKLKHLKEGHLTDAYCGIMKGMLACFLEGIQS